MTGRLATYLVLLLWFMAGSGFVQAQENQPQENQSQDNPVHSIIGETVPEKSVKPACLPSHEVRGLVERGEVIPVHKAMQMARSRFGGEIVKARLCPEPDRLIYLLTLLDKNSHINLVAMDARTGQLIVRP